MTARPEAVAIETGGHEIMTTILAVSRSIAASLVILGAATAFAQRGGAALPPPAEIAAPAIPGVIAQGTKIVLVKGDFRRTEGPVAMPDGGIVFTNNNFLTRLDAAGSATTFVEVSNGANGLGFDTKGRLIAVERKPMDERVGVLYPPDAVTTLADKADGKPFEALNDLVVSSRDAVYFTDHNGVYYLPAGGGKVTKVAEGIPNPNGVQLSPDERTLYANNKDGEYLLAFDVKPDGTLANRRNFAKYKSVTQKDSKDPLLAEDNGADGLAVDNDGRVYVATNVGVEVFSPKGDMLGIIPAIWGGDIFMLKKPQNLAFSGPGKKTLYMVGAGAVFKVQTLTQGVNKRAK
jgi:gluconolactonase